MRCATSSSTGSAYAIDSTTPEPKARMIKLQEREAAMAAESVAAKQPFVIIPFTVILFDLSKPIILSHDADFVRFAESQNDLSELLKKNEFFPLAGYQVVVRSIDTYAAGRTMHECFAIKPGET